MLNSFRLTSSPAAPDLTLRRIKGFLDEMQEEESHHGGKYTHRKRVKRSLVESRSPVKRMQGRSILAYNWVTQRITLIIIIGSILILLVWLTLRYKGPATDYYYPPQSEEP